MDFLCGILSLILIVGFVFMFIKINYIDHYYADKKKNETNPNICPPVKQEINNKITEEIPDGTNTLISTNFYCPVCFTSLDYKKHCFRCGYTSILGPPLDRLPEEVKRKHEQAEHHRSAPVKIFYKPEIRVVKPHENKISNVKENEHSVTPLRVHADVNQKRYKDNWREFKSILDDYHIRSIYHFTDSCNISSIKKLQGLFSWQELRKRGIPIPRPGGNELSRHLDKNFSNYVRLCFNLKHPMRYVAEKDGRIQCCVFLEIDPTVIYWQGTYYSHINATDSKARPGDTINDFRKIDFEVLKKSDWHGEHERKLFQAEVMVLKNIPLKYILNINQL